MSKQELDYHIEEYLNGTLPLNKMVAFEQALQENTALQTEVAERRDTIEALQDYFAFEDSKQAFRKLLEDVRQDGDQKKVPRVIKTSTQPLFLRYLYRIAAVLAFTLFVGVAYFTYQKLNKPTVEELAMQFYVQTTDKLLSEISGTMGAGEEQKTQQVLDEAEALFLQQKSGEAVVLLDTITLDNPKYYEATLLKSLCYFSQSNWKQLSEQLKILQEHPDKTYEDHANWLAALITLHQNKNISKAKRQLQNLIDEESSYRQEAQKLLEKL